MTMNEPAPASLSGMSKMLTLVRKWREQAYEAELGGKAESLDTLRRKFGLKSPPEDERKPAA